MARAVDNRVARLTKALPWLRKPRRLRLRPRCRLQLLRPRLKLVAARRKAARRAAVTTSDLWNSNSAS